MYRFKKVKHLYDCNLAIKDIDGHSPRFSDMVNGEKIEAELYIRRMPLSDCSPQDEKACAEFVHKLYREKVRFF